MTRGRRGWKVRPYSSSSRHCAESTTRTIYSRPLNRIIIARFCLLYYGKALHYAAGESPLGNAVWLTTQRPSQSTRTAWCDTDCCDDWMMKYLRRRQTLRWVGHYKCRMKTKKRYKGSPQARVANLRGKMSICVNPRAPRFPLLAPHLLRHTTVEYLISIAPKQ